MSIDLLSALSQYQSPSDFENSIASFKVLVPWIGPEAFLHIVYKPAEPDLLFQVAETLKFPATWTALLRGQNGATLFSGDLTIYGVVRPAQLLKRNDCFSLPPFNIEQENSARVLDRDRFLVIGGYRSDGSRAHMDRGDSSVHRFKKGEHFPISSWPTLADWLTAEIARLKALFDHQGRRLV